MIRFDPSITGVERFEHEAAYVAALTVYLIETKCNEADAELGEILTEKPFMLSIVIGVIGSFFRQ